MKFPESLHVVIILVEKVIKFYYPGTKKVSKQMSKLTFNNLELRILFCRNISSEHS